MTSFTAPPGAVFGYFIIYDHDEIGLFSWRKVQSFFLKNLLYGFYYLSHKIESEVPLFWFRFSFSSCARSNFLFFPGGGFEKFADVHAEDYRPFPLSAWSKAYVGSLYTRDISAANLALFGGLLLGPLLLPA
ncbi:MAG: hypothetical protein M0Z61_03220 [Nitrospiraceae bacterium]|nr:hypothetical protein [Nitrospiraceae bacterium]